jgi:hypothetical protein
MVDAMLIAAHASGLLLGFWCGGRLARAKPHLMRWLFGL